MTLNGGTLVAKAVIGTPTAPGDHLMAHWAFEGNANDTTGTYNGTLVGDAGFSPDGRVGQALELDGSNANNAYVDLPDGFEDFSNGFSVALWAKPTEVRNWARFIDFGNAAGVDNILFTDVDDGIAMFIIIIKKKILFYKILIKNLYLKPGIFNVTMCNLRTVISL